MLSVNLLSHYKFAGYLHEDIEQNFYLGYLLTLLLSQHHQSSVLSTFSHTHVHLLCNLSLPMV